MQYNSKENKKKMIDYFLLLYYSTIMFTTIYVVGLSSQQIFKLYKNKDQLNSNYKNIYENNLNI